MKLFDNKGPGGFPGGCFSLWDMVCSGSPKHCLLDKNSLLVDRIRVAQGIRAQAFSESGDPTTWNCNGYKNSHQGSQPTPQFELDARSGPASRDGFKGMRITSFWLDLSHGWDCVAGTGIF
mmetsp:Transcript_19932/g.32829  ORF Transcript_19932/g.32829 Transcript_19932/m.32829 type:complete len:121 (+) Transcript_19932:1203-1565(+)